ncbi:ABC transporter permease [Synoicihabitans lomoniglobus]|uniref:ABC transporter permease n=1 Tax=Synoicihabitans lomoniglobus TaxID=2909285 RepID=A0AAE9ZXY3_9BACT|nr:ABC transporter permease [Opitutaceae bacterium LMO-M01]WED65020.1 ABC transporter permease [Opitutaceae bacterium LMO-M01]
MKRWFYEFNESVRIAFAQIRANKMRSSLTALGVVIGIVAVTLMVTAILGINKGVDDSFKGFGDDVFYVGKWPWKDTEEWWVYRNRRDIRTTYSEQINAWIKRSPDTALLRAVPNDSTGVNVVRGDLRVSGIFLLGTSHQLSLMSKSDMAEGRFFNEFEDQQGSKVAVIGFDVADALFPNESPLGQTVLVRGAPFRVVGVSARQGSFLGIFSFDSSIIIPIKAYRYNINGRDEGEVRVQYDVTRSDEARDQLRGLMRRIRQLDPEERDDFEINESSTIREQLDPIKNGIATAGLVITGLALFVGAIGIMNITYVSVKERTREIGTRKALGARRRSILLQFLVEAVCICLVGGLIGLALTWGLAGLIAMAAPSFPIVFSPTVVVVAMTLATAVGVASGFLPALSASSLDPVEALRYE